MKNLTFVAIFLVLSSKILALSELDSLKLVCQNSGLDTNKVHLLVAIGKKYYSVNQDSGIYYGEKAYNLSKNLNYYEGLGSSLRLIAWHNVDKGDYDAAIAFFYDALRLHEKANNQINVAGSYKNLGAVYYYMGHSKAMKYWIKAAQIYERNELTNKAADIYNNISAYYIRINSSDSVNTSDSSLIYGRKALNIYIANNDLYGMAGAYINLGNVLRDYTGHENLPKALNYYNKALDIFIQSGNELNAATAHLNIATLERKRSNLKTANEQSFMALNLFKKIHNTEGIKDCYRDICELYRDQKEYSLALSYSDSLRKLETQLRSESADKAIAEMETKYETEKKEKENQLLKKSNELQRIQNERSRLMNLGLGGGVLTLFLIAGLIFMQFRAKKKANVILGEQNEEILAQRDQIEEQNGLLEKKNEHILSSIQYAKRIQEAILPSDELLIGNLTDSFVMYRPKDIVSGDFYWMEVIGSKIFWATVDCTGHGVPGAFMSILGANGLKKIVTERNIHKPSEILDHLTKHVISSIKETKDGEEVKDGMDIALCCWDKQSNKLSYAGAYNPLYLIREEELIIKKATKRPIGRFKRKNMPDFENHVIELKKDDCIYIFTDGYADQFGGSDGSKYTYRKMRDLIFRHHRKPMEDQLVILETEFDEWKGAEEQLDDICIFGVRV